MLQVSEGADGGVLVEGLGAIALGLCSVHNDDTEGQWTRQALKQVINHRVGVRLKKTLCLLMFYVHPS